MAGKRKERNDDKSNTIELEGKRKRDNSWHRCEVSLSSDSPCTSLYVHFLSLKNDEHDVITRKDEALACLRVCSTNLADGECLQVKEGEAVIALQKTRAGGQYFDAEVEKVKRLKHSTRVFCRCTFEIRWLESEIKGERVTVPASSIRRLVQESITKHPTVSTFFEALPSAKQTPVSPELPGPVPEESDVEIDIHDRLEQQIEEIAKLVDTSKSSASKDILCKHINVDSKQIQENVNVSDENAWCSKDDNGDVSVRTSRKKKNVVRSHRMPRKPITIHAATVLHLEKRPRLSPLAARAALAAAVWDSPLDEKRMDNLNDILGAKGMDYISPMAHSSKFKDKHDKMSLNLSDTCLDIRHHSKGKRVTKIATKTIHGKPLKQSRSKTKRNEVYNDRANKKGSNIVSSDYSRFQRSVSVSAKQEALSDIASTAKGNDSLIQQGIRQTQKEASKEVNSAKSRNKYSGAAPTRCSPRFHVGSRSNFDKQEASGSLQNGETEKNEPIVMENVQRKNGPYSASRVKGKKERKPSDITDQEPESTTTISMDPNEVRKRSQENEYNHRKRNGKGASGGRKNAKHLRTGDGSENFNGAIEEDSKDSGDAMQASDTESLKARKLKRAKMTTSDHKYLSLTNGSTENSIGMVEEKLDSKKTSKTRTLKGKGSNNETSPIQVGDSYEDETKEKSSKRKMTRSKEGEFRKVAANARKNLKAELQVGPEMKNHVSINRVTRSSPRLRVLPRTH